MCEKESSKELLTSIYFRDLWWEFSGSWHASELTISSHTLRGFAHWLMQKTSDVSILDDDLYEYRERSD